MNFKNKIGFGGGCHWCTEAVFQSLIGIDKVDQGWVASTRENEAFSEAVVVHFNSEIINLKNLIEIHLHTHSSTSNHAMREKYRSAIYVFSEEDGKQTKEILLELQKDFEKPLITKVLPYVDFKLNTENFLDYYYSNPEKGFCKNWVNPKLKLILKKFSKIANHEKLKHLKNQ